MSYSDLGNDLRTEAGSTTFVNGPLGITAKKTGNNIIYYTRDSNGTILNSHGAGGTVNYVSEFNGSVAALYSATGTELGSCRYSPYGQTTATGAAAECNRFRYIGGHQDKNSNGDDSYYKLGARYYDGHGHFTQPDSIAGTISNPKTLTAYNYAGGDPVNASDPSGNSFIGDVAGALGGGAVAAVGTATICAATAVVGCIAGGVAAGVVGGVISTGITTGIDDLSATQSRGLLARNVLGGGVLGALGPLGRAASSLRAGS